MEAHEGSLRALALTADGALLATASEKGTVIRVWNVANSQCLHEFRRGVERAVIRCLAWSWDHAWLACVSDKGTAHIFQLEEDEEKTNRSSTSTSNTSTSLTSMLLSSVRKSVEGEARKSVCQIRGVPHPVACTFIAAAPHMVAIAGWDADGNGVLLLAEFQPGQEPQRRGYHVLCKSSNDAVESEEARRRRRLRGWTPAVPATPEGGRLHVGERAEENGLEQIEVVEGKDDDEFVSVVKKDVDEKKEPAVTDGENVDAKTEDKENENGKGTEDEGEEGSRNSNTVDSGTVGDSVRTEPLDDETADPSVSTT